MTQQEGNKLIAIFDDFVLHTDHPEYDEVFYSAYDVHKINAIPVHELNYDLSWDALMPIVEKFMSIPMETFNYKPTAMSELRQCKESIKGLSIATPISDVWNHLVASIKWYNEQSK